MLEAPFAIPERFQPAYQRIKQLEQEERYLGAFLFGSLARGEANDRSDVDVIVVVKEDNPCTNINHPIINGVKLDLTFTSLPQLKTSLKSEIAKEVQPKAVTPAEYQFIQFMFYHGNNKVERNLASDPATALFVMHVGLADFLKFHYQIHGKWWVSSKRMLDDLRNWDGKLAQLVEAFIVTCDIQAKFQLWSAIIDHILQPIGGRQPIAENNCNCSVCQKDLSMITGKSI